MATLRFEPDPTSLLKIEGLAKVLGVGTDATYEDMASAARRIAPASVDHAGSQAMPRLVAGLDGDGGTRLRTTGPLSMAALVGRLASGHPMRAEVETTPEGPAIASVARAFGATLSEGPDGTSAIGDDAAFGYGAAMQARSSGRKLAILAESPDRRPAIVTIGGNKEPDVRLVVSTGIMARDGTTTWTERSIPADERFMKAMADPKAFATAEAAGEGAGRRGATRYQDGVPLPAVRGPRAKATLDAFETLFAADVQRHPGIPAIVKAAMISRKDEADVLGILVGERHDTGRIDPADRIRWLTETTTAVMANRIEASKTHPGLTALVQRNPGHPAQVWAAAGIDNGDHQVMGWAATTAAIGPQAWLSLNLLDAATVGGRVARWSVERLEARPQAVRAATEYHVGLASRDHARFEAFDESDNRNLTRFRAYHRSFEMSPDQADAAVGLMKGKNHDDVERFVQGVGAIAQRINACRIVESEASPTHRGMELGVDMRVAHAEALAVIVEAAAAHKAGRGPAVFGADGSLAKAMASEGVFVEKTREAILGPEAKGAEHFAIQIGTPSRIGGYAVERIDTTTKASKAHDKHGLDADVVREAQENGATVVALTKPGRPPVFAAYDVLGSDGDGLKPWPKDRGPAPVAIRLAGVIGRNMGEPEADGVAAARRLGIEMGRDTPALERVLRANAMLREARERHGAGFDRRAFDEAIRDPALLKAYAPAGKRSPDEARLIDKTIGSLSRTTRETILDGMRRGDAQGTEPSRQWTRDNTALVMREAGQEGLRRFQDALFEGATLGQRQAEGRAGWSARLETEAAEIRRDLVKTIDETTKRNEKVRSGRTASL